MPPGLSDDQFCFPGVNSSCLRSQFTVGTQVVLYVLLTLGMLVTVLGNSIVIMSIGHFKQLHNPTNVFVASLALADLLVGVLVMPLSAVQTVSGCWFYGEDLCLLHCVSDVFLTTVSIFNLVCIAVDRHQAICNPMHYSRRISIPVAWVMVCLVWFVVIAQTCAAVYSKGMEEGLEDYIESINCLGSCFRPYNPIFGILDGFIAFFIPCMVMLCLYTKIFIVSREHAKKIRDMKCEQTAGGLVKQSEHKAAKTLSVVLGAFFICWVPFIIYSVIYSCSGFSTPDSVFKALSWLGYFNSALNPIIYALFYPWFKKCFYLIINLKIFKPNSSTIKVHILAHL